MEMTDILCHSTMTNIIHCFFYPCHITYRFSTHFLPLFVKADHKYRQHAMIPTPPKTMYIPSIIISSLIC